MWDSCIRLKNSLAIIKLSVAYMWTHKKLWVFPLLITVCLAPLFISIFVYGINHAHEYPIFRLLFLLLVAYFVSSFISTFFGVALSHATLKLFEKEPESIFTSLRKSVSRLKLITEWSVLFSFMHFNLSALTPAEHEHESSEQQRDQLASRRKQVTRAAGSIAEFAWELTVFLVLPIIAFESAPLTGLLNHAMQRMKECFGDVIVAQFSFYTVNILTWALAAGVILLSLAFGNFYITTILLVIAVFTLAVIFTAQIIFKTAVYAHCHTRSTGIFSPDLIKHYFGKKKE